MANKKIIRLTEQDLKRMVRRIIKESASEDDLIVATYNLLYDLGYDHIEDDYIQNLEEAAETLENELYDRNHGPIMDKEIEDLLTRIYDFIGYPDHEEGENIEDHL